MVKDAYNKCDSGFYIAYNGGQKPTILTLEEAVDDERSNHLDVPQELIDFEQALR
jgi:hypothetical protein